MPPTFFLQAAADTVAALAPTPAMAPQSLSLWYLLKEGGLLMIPLGLCSVILVYVFVERWLYLRRVQRADPALVPRVREQLSRGAVDGAQSIARTASGPLARTVEKGLSRLARPLPEIEKGMETTARLEVYGLEKNLGVLTTLSRIAPMFGFLGTIAGMIVLFFNIQRQGFELENIAGGIYTKMVTSAVGLIIGLLAYVAHDYLSGLVGRIVARVEAGASEALEAMADFQSSRPASFVGSSPAAITS